MQDLQMRASDVERNTRAAGGPSSSRRRPVEGWESLTDAERRVARLVAEGLTNAQAGGTLFLSRHTIDFHLRQIFRKLNVHSRVGMTRLVLQFESNPQ